MSFDDLTPKYVSVLLYVDSLTSCVHFILHFALQLDTTT